MVPKDLRKKWDPKSRKLLFMVHCENKKGYRLINPIDKKIIFSQDVKFLEKKEIVKKTKLRNYTPYLWLIMKMKKRGNRSSNRNRCERRK